MTVTIGPFTNVPAPGDPIRSNWPQSTATYITNNVLRKDIGTSQTVTSAVTFSAAIAAASVTASTGNIVATAGNIQATAGSVNIPQGNLTTGAADATNPGGYMRSDGAGLSYISGASGASLILPNWNLCRGGTPGNATGVYVRFSRGATNTSGNGTEIGSITADTGGATVKYNTSSDYRLKNDHGPIVDAVQRLTLLVPRRFAWKSDPDTEVDGFFAHEVTPAVPEAVTGDKDGVYPDDHPYTPGEPAPQQLDVSRLVPLLTAAVLELAARVAALEAAA